MHHSLKHRRRVVHQRYIKARQKAAELPPLPAVAETQAEQTPISPQATGPEIARKHTLAEDLHDWILGGQDGLVNVLGSILGVAIVTESKTIILVAGLASLFAESISMAAVAYTSVKASHSYYHSEREATRKAIVENPVLQREVVIDVYERKGFSRSDAIRIADELTKRKEAWLDTIMEEHLKLPPPDDEGPVHSAWIVGTASLIGSLIPLIPFFFMARDSAIVVSCITSVLVLFAAGAIAAKMTIGDWKRRGLEMAVIGTAAAAVSFAIGWMFTSGVVHIR